jgi:hypothetical protein
MQPVQNRLVNEVPAFPRINPQNPQAFERQMKAREAQRLGQSLMMYGMASGGDIKSEGPRANMPQWTRPLSMMARQFLRPAAAAGAGYAAGQQQQDQPAKRGK